MTEFIGPRPEWDDHAAGTVRLEVDLELWSNSGRPQHTDITAQGAWLVETVTNALRQMTSGGGDLAVHDIRYFGQVEPSADNPVLVREVNILPA